MAVLFSLKDLMAVSGFF